MDDQDMYREYLNPDLLKERQKFDAAAIHHRKMYNNYLKARELVNNTDKSWSQVRKDKIEEAFNSCLTNAVYAANNYELARKEYTEAKQKLEKGSS